MLQVHLAVHAEVLYPAAVDLGKLPPSLAYCAGSFHSTLILFVLQLVVAKLQDGHKQIPCLRGQLMQNYHDSTVQFYLLRWGVLDVYLHTAHCISLNCYRWLHCIGAAVQQVAVR